MPLGPAFIAECFASFKCIRYAFMSIRPMKKSLRTFSSNLHSEFQDEESGIHHASGKGGGATPVDFGSAGLYVGGLQTVAAVITAAVVSIISCWALPSSVVSGVRTLVATALTSFLVVYRAVRIGKVRGVSMLFAALRPCVFIYLMALTLEELGHASCRGDGEDAHAVARRIVYHVCTVVMMATAFARAQSPRSDSDLPFTITVICLATIAVLPTPSSSSHGPLSESPRTLMDAGERVLRATLFSFTYSMHVYASAPQRNVGSELLVCVGRASAASVWILCCSPILLIAFPIQVALCVVMSISFNNSHQHEYESVPLTTKDLSSKQHDNLSTTDSEHEIPHRHTIEQDKLEDVIRTHSGNGNSKVHQLRNDGSDTEEASASCSSDFEFDLSRGKYGVFQPLSSSSAPAPRGLSFSFSGLQQVTTPISNDPSPELIASALAREE